MEGTRPSPAAAPPAAHDTLRSRRRPGPLRTWEGSENAKKCLGMGWFLRVSLGGFGQVRWFLRVSLGGF